jgi:hypothetical protein
LNCISEQNFSKEELFVSVWTGKAIPITVTCIHCEVNRYAITTPRRVIKVKADFALINLPWIVGSCTVPEKFIVWILSELVL